MIRSAPTISPMSCEISGRLQSTNIYISSATHHSHQSALLPEFHRPVSKGSSAAQCRNSPRSSMLRQAVNISGIQDPYTPLFLCCPLLRPGTAVCLLHRKAKRNYIHIWPLRNNARHVRNLSKQYHRC